MQRFVTVCQCCDYINMRIDHSGHVDDCNVLFALHSAILLAKFIDW